MKHRTAPAGVSVTLDGKTYEGHWTVERGTVRVVSTYGEKSAEVGGSPADFVAKRLLRELVRAGQG
jgi:hypothetical protein